MTMSKKTILICDCCGREKDVLNLNKFIRYDYFWERRTESYDICGECLLEIKAKVNNNKTEINAHN